MHAQGKDICNRKQLQMNVEDTNPTVLCCIMAGLGAWCLFSVMSRQNSDAGDVSFVGFCF
jgi:hypothetical protein